MKNVQELIALGKVPSDTIAAINVAGYPDGWPILSDLVKQVEYDWNNLPSDRVRTLKASRPDYKKALDTFLIGPAPATEGSVLPAPTVTPGPSVEEEIQGASDETVPSDEGSSEANAPAGEEPVLAGETEPAAAPSGAQTGDVVEYDGLQLVKTADGYEIRIELDGTAGVQVFRGKDPIEVALKLAKAQRNASALIRKQQQDKEQAMLNEPADMAREEKIFKPRQLTADEQYELAEALQSGDPTKINKALAKRDAIIMGGNPEEVIAEIQDHKSRLQVESYKATAKAFIKQNPDVLFTAELTDAIDEILAGNKWDYTVRNLNKALAQLKAEEKVTLKVSDEEPEEAEIKRLPAPTSVPAVAAKPAAAPVHATPKPVVPARNDGDRLRPGSASTGLSPRQTSVRQGATKEPSKSVGLTAEEYNRMPALETRRKYQTDRGFREAVDKLMAEGKI